MSSDPVTVTEESNVNVSPEMSHGQKYEVTHGRQNYGMTHTHVSGTVGADAPVRKSILSGQEIRLRDKAVSWADVARMRGNETSHSLQLR